MRPEVARERVEVDLASERIRARLEDRVAVATVGHEVAHGDAIARGCALPRHTDSAEEVPHQVRNAGEQQLRFVAVYAGTGVVTSYGQPVQPEGESEQQTIG